MLDRPRTQSGKFAAKSDEPRHVRSIRLTDSTWEKLGQLAKEKSTLERCITRADLIEEWMQDNQVLHGQLNLFEFVDKQELPAKLDFQKLEDDLHDNFVSAMKKESKLGESATSFKAAKKAFRLTIKTFREKLGY